MRSEYGSVRPWEVSEFTLNEMLDTLEMIKHDDEAREKAMRESARDSRMARTRRKRGR